MELRKNKPISLEGSPAKDKDFKIIIPINKSVISSDSTFGELINTKIKRDATEE